MTQVSQKAATLIGSEIIKLGNEINQKIREGHHIYNLTIGDFNPKIFPIPAALKQYIIDAYTADQTNYPPADGVPELKEAIRKFISKYEGLDFGADELMVAGGGRPLIYAIYQTIVDKKDKVLYPVPSWNNNHYCHLTEAEKIEIHTKPENGFMPMPEELAPHISDAVLLALCSPLNPTGTTFRKENLEAICDLVIEENKRRGTSRKPLYVLYDQIYWMLRTDGIEHYNPVTLKPEMKEYTIFVDGISKSLAATGVRVGWSMGPSNVISRMKSILGHVGAWAPRAEQVATAKFLDDETSLTTFLEELKHKLDVRFQMIHEGITGLKQKGYPLDIIEPEGAIYLTVQFALKGLATAEGRKIETTQDITDYLLNQAGLAVVPFTAFGCDADTDWYRISVGTLKEIDITELMIKLEAALQKLTK